MKTCPTCQHEHAKEITFCPHDGTRLRADAALPAGRLIYGRYEIETLIAETRIGQIYRARDLRLDRRVALETFRPELSRDVAGWLRRLRRDLRVLFQSSPPNIVGVYHVTDDFVVMGYVEGQTLDQELRRRGRFTPREVTEVLEPVAGALDAVRARGIACEFLTPADIMFRRAGNNLPAVQLLPSIFNRQFIESDAGGTAHLIGVKTEASVAAPYVAPELLNTAVKSPAADARALVYSLAVISYELMSGLKPDDALTASENALKPAAGQPLRPLAELAPDVPPGVARVVERALARTAMDRPASAGEFVAELQDALGVDKGEITESPLKMARATRQPLAKKRPRGIVIKPRDDASASADASVTDKPIYMDENVQFTVYQPEAVAPARWHTLLAFAHLSKRRPGAPPDEPEPLAEVKRIAARVLADQSAEYDTVKQNSLHAVPQQGEITFVPEVAGCEFNPPSQSFSWQKSVHKVEFELRAAVSLDGRVECGRLTVFLGTLILADVPLAIRVDSASRGAAGEVPSVPASAAPYRKIFPSYSHKDRAVVEQIEHHVHALGDTYLRDVSELRAGQDWQRWMRDAITEADVFQLFWSHNSMRSAYVRQEWEYALSLGRPNFVRPTYWEVPLPESPAENLPPAELRQLHFQHLRANTIATHPTPAAWASDDSDVPLFRALGQRLSDDLQQLFAQAGTVESSDARSVEADVVCANCGGRNLPEKAFCQTCGAALGATAPPSAQVGAAQSSTQPAETHEQELSSALDIFWEKRPREVRHNLPPPPSYSQPSMSPRMKGGRSTLWLMLLFFVALAVGVFLLVRLL